MTETAQTAPETNDYEKLKKPLQDIMNLSNTLDERYREKCFEILLNYTLTGGVVAPKACVALEAPAQKKVMVDAEDLSTEVKLFLDQYNITEQMLAKLFVREKGEIHPLYKITETRKARAQIQIALLTAFENALTTPNSAFEFSLNKVRQRCQEIKMYEGTDFFINFMNSAGLFGSLNYEVVKLSSTGKGELANILLALAK